MAGTEDDSSGSGPGGRRSRPRPTLDLKPTAVTVEMPSTPAATEASPASTPEAVETAAQVAAQPVTGEPMPEHQVTPEAVPEKPELSAETVPEPSVTAPAEDAAAASEGRPSSGMVPKWRLDDSERPAATAEAEATSEKPEVPSEAAQAAAEPPPETVPEPAPFAAAAENAAPASEERPPAGAGLKWRLDDSELASATRAEPRLEAPQEAAQQPPPEAHKRPTTWHPVALVVGAGAGAAAGALALLAASWLLGMPLGPDQRVAESATRVQALEARVSQLAARPAPDRRLDELTARMTRLEGAGGADPEFPKRVGAVEETTKLLTATLAELSGRVDEAVTVARASREAATRASATASETAASVTTGIETLNKRIAALEETSKTLQAALAQVRAAEADRPARFGAAALALRSAVESGAPFAAELAVVRTLVDAAKLAPLEPFAATGVPSVATLARELTALIAAARKPAPGTAGAQDNPDNTGWFERLQAGASKLVRIRPADTPAPLDPADVLARVQASAARGDLAAALAEAAKLPETARAPIEPWIQRAQARATALAAAQELFRASLKDLAIPSVEPGTR